MLDILDLWFFSTLGTISRSGYWRTKGLVKIFTQMWRKETVCDKIVVVGCKGLYCA